MCSVSDDIEELNLGDCSSSDKLISDDLQQQRSLNLCKKCGEQSVVLLQKKDPFCKPCFLTYCNHKFRATIGKSKKVKSGSKVLICHSGGPSSTAMFHMVKEALKDASPKKLVLKPGVLYISESCLSNLNDETEAGILSTIQREAQDFDCEILSSSLDMAFRDDETRNFYWDSSEVQDHQNHKFKKKLTNCLEGIKSLSAKQEFIEILRIQLMVDVAENSGYSYLFVGDSATSLANNVLTSIAFGRGSQISSNMVFNDTRHNVTICRPLREFLKKELAFYNKLNDLQCNVHPSILTMTDSYSSIQRLTEKFVSDLQENFPATVFTIFRTGGKVTTNHGATEKCIFCQSALDNVNPHSCSALEAMELTAKLSRNDSINQELASFSSCDQDEKIDYDLESLKHCMCHGCQVLLNEMTCLDLPNYTLRKITELNSSKNIHNEIKDFLLDNPDKDDQDQNSAA